MPRQHKTERQRAEEALGVAQRKVEHLRKQKAGLRTQLDQADKALADAERLLEYRTSHPALPTGNRRVDAGTANPEENPAP